jgi:3-oxoadipate enol-lactonase
MPRNESGAQDAESRGEGALSTQIIERLAVEVEGAGEALVMLHGLGGTSNVYTPQMSLVAPRFRVIRPDLPGSGRSAAIPTLTLTAMIEIVLRALRVMGVEQAHLVGHSMGSIVCQHIAVQQPALVKSLVLLGPLLSLPDAARQAMRERATKARSEGMGEIAGGVVTGATSGDTKNSNPVAIAFIRELLMRQDAEGYARNCEALAESSAADVSQIRCRVLLMAGDEDAIAPPSTVRAMAQQIEWARVVVLNRCGHWLTIERAAEVTGTLKEFYFGRR